MFFALACGSIKRKCVRMIQPVSAFTPRATFRGSSFSKDAKSVSASRIALINAGGVAAAAGGVTTAIARGYTSSWAQAGVLGLFGAFLAMFFMTPHLVDKSVSNKLSKKGGTESVSKSTADKAIKMAEEHLKPAKKLVQFRSDGTPANS